MTTRTHDPDLTPAQLVEIARGGEPDKGVARMRALAAIQLHPSEDAGGVLMQILAQKDEPIRFRHMAAMGLYRLGGATGREHLAQAARRADEGSAAPIALGLGRIGTPDQMAIIERLESIAPDHEKNHAKFAATLLAYRFGLPDHDVVLPRAQELQSLDADKARPIVIRPAPSGEAKRAANALETEPLEAGITPANATHVECEPNIFVWLWSKQPAGEELLGEGKEKAVAGILTVRSPVENSYSLALVGLVTPRRGGNLITLHRPRGGEVLYAGTVGADGTFALKARKWPGLAAVDIAARIAAGRIEVSVAASSAVAAKAKMPEQVKPDTE